jgi:hypothetical protein
LFENWRKDELLLFPGVVSLNLWEEKWFIDGKIILLYSSREVAMAVYLAVSFMITLRSLEEVPTSRRPISHNSIISIIIIILFIDRSVR